MKLFRKEIAMWFLLLCVGFSLYAESETAVNFSPEQQFVAQSNKRRGQPSVQPRDTWKPYFTHIRDMQAPRSFFINSNIGVGFLYFNKIRGNIAPQSAALFQGNTLGALNVGHLAYNRTPLYEYMIGHRMNNWLKFALSFQNQSGIVVTTNAIRAKGNNPQTSADVLGSFTSYLELDSLMLKTYFELPHPFVVKTAAFIPYLAIGFGPTWQSWTDNTASYNFVAAGFQFNEYQPIRQKIIANCGLMVDLGLRMKSAYPGRRGSFVAGCKYNQWGQVRDIGKLSQQGIADFSFTTPVRVKTLYSFAPYMGFQWNFAEGSSLKTSKKAMKGQRALWSRPSMGQKYNTIFTQSSIGVGFLYFDDANTIFAGQPPLEFTPNGFAPLKGHLRYNRTPVYESVIGFQPLSWFKYGLSLQMQQNVTVSTKPLDTFTASSQMRMLFSSHVSIYTVMAKFYFQTPWYLNFYKNIMASPYIAFGVGPGWQAWTKNTLYMYDISVDGENTLILRQKTTASCAWMADAGFNFRGAGNYSPFAMALGCKYNQYGKAGNIGKLSQTQSMKFALWKPFDIKTVYSFAPYVSLSWNFPVTHDYMINKKPINRWKPFYANVRNLQKQRSLFVQSNIGVGFLYFSGVKGNLAAVPGNLHLSNTNPVEGKMQYNRSPLLEYLIGYRVFQWFKVALSYQHQGAVFVQTPLMRGFEPTNSAVNTFSQLRAQFEVNGFMAKTYFELPYAFIMKSWASTPYLGLGVGFGWQSWTDPQVNYLADSGPSWQSTAIPIMAKYSCNAIWGLDAGIRVRNAVDSAPLSIVAGCKYNQWGQARSIGDIQDQGSSSNGLLEPFSVKVVYSFAPYLGVQWNF